METLGFIASKLVDAFVVAGVAWPFIPQARSILRTGDANAYSLLTSLVVIVSATLRCFFWLNDRFETTLLVQAVVAILAHLAMIYVVVFVKQRNRAANPTGKPLKTLSDLDWQQFWSWDDWESYAQVEMLLVMALMAAQVLFAGPAYSQVLGTLSLGIEAMLPVPQAVKNFQNKSTQGVSSVMIVAWLAGDFFKTIYAVSKAAPAQFIACGVFQLAVDVLLALQLYVLYPQTNHAPLGAAAAGQVGATAGPASLAPFDDAAAEMTTTGTGGKARRSDATWETADVGGDDETAPLGGGPGSALSRGISGGGIDAEVGISTSVAGVTPAAAHALAASASSLLSGSSSASGAVPRGLSRRPHSADALAAAGGASVAAGGSHALHVSGGSGSGDHPHPAAVL